MLVVDEDERCHLGKTHQRSTIEPSWDGQDALGVWSRSFRSLESDC